MANLPNICKCGQEATVIQGKRKRADGSIYVYMICRDCKRLNHQRSNYRKPTKQIKRNTYTDGVDFKKLSEQSVSRILNKQRLGYYG